MGRLHWNRPLRPVSFFAQIGAIGLLRRAIRRRRATTPPAAFRGVAARPRTSPRAPRARAARTSPDPASCESECVKQGVSAARRRRVAIATACRDGDRRRDRERRAGAVVTRRGGPVPENFSPGLLTGEKTVISFRPSRGDLRTRVSRATGTTRSTTKPSALEHSKVDSGSVSLAKPVKPSCTLRNDDLHRRAMRVFCCQESVPARHARRRLLAGPTPAAFQTGLQYP